MSLRIAHNVEAMAAHRHLGVSADRLSVAMRRLSSGLRINSAADDAAGLGVAERMRSQIRGLEQANRNIQDGISLLQTLEGSLQEVHSILQRARDLAVQQVNGTYSFTDKVAIREELFALSAEIGRIEQVTEFNGIKLLQDDTTLVTFQIGANGGEILAINLVDLMGPNVGDLIRPNTFFTVPWWPADIDGFDMHITDVATARGRVGSTINRLEHAMRANEQSMEALMGAESRIRDTDMAKEMAALTKAQILQQSGTTALLFAQQTPARLVDLLSNAGRAGNDTDRGLASA